MIRRDEIAIVETLKSFLDDNKYPTALAFDIRDISSALRNTRTWSDKLIYDLNELLSKTQVCRTLRGVYTVCEYEGFVCFLIRADGVISTTDLFVPSSKVFVRSGAVVLSAQELHDRGLSE